MGGVAEVMVQRFTGVNFLVFVVLIEQVVGGAKDIVAEIVKRQRQTVLVVESGNDAFAIFLGFLLFLD